MHLTIKTDSEYWKNHPTYKNARKNEDIGLDVPTPEDIIVPAGECGFLVDLGIKTEPTNGFMLAPRSSISKTPLRLSNSIGFIDKSYRGNIKAAVDNISEEPFTLRGGKCYFQIVSFSGLLPKWNLGEVRESSRGSGGFGSTTS
jgi:dUTP pyrophosphatase